jgi:phosphoribosyl 1,2-cyclic phosphate phosphodiesterase
MHVTLLGTGTSTGVPMIACQCPTCSSPDLRDKRLRVSVLVQSETTNIVIDTSADFRQQMLTAGIRDLDAVLYTHHHTDHIAGFDDLRAFQFLRRRMPMCYALEETYHVIQRTFPYAFGLVENTGGGGVPNIPFTVITDKPFTVSDIEIQPIYLEHGSLTIAGYRIGNFAYLTDCNGIPLASREKLMGLEVLVLDGLRWQDHPSHFSIPESLEMIKLLRPKMTYLTHMNHDVLHAEAEAKLPPHVRLAYDGLGFTL